MSSQKRRLYDTDDQVWIRAATHAISLKQAVVAVDVAGYPAWRGLTGRT